ncbi:unnamed protein product [Prunus armeniaca]
MDGTVLLPFDLDPSPRLSLEMEELFLAGIEDVDFASVRWEAKEIDARELARTKASDFFDRVQKSVLSTANAFGDMYLTLARVEKEVALVKCHSESAKAAIAKA